MTKDYQRGIAAAESEISGEGWTRETAVRWLDLCGLTAADRANEGEYGKGYNAAVRQFAGLQAAS